MQCWKTQKSLLTHSRQDNPLATFCSSEILTTEELNMCVGEIDAGLICNDDLRGVVPRTCDDQIRNQYTDVFFWLKNVAFFEYQKWDSLLWWIGYIKQYVTVYIER